jgi:cytochrome subunit of sulfide dehydrogenase
MDAYASVCWNVSKNKTTEEHSMKRLALFAALGLSVCPAYAAEVNIEGLANTCNSCHSVGGASAGPTMPSIGGQPEGYLKMVMDQYRSGQRYSTAMGRLLKGYGDAEIDALAKYFSKQAWVSAPQDLDAALIQQGAAKAATCAACHGAKGELMNPTTPRIGGQWAKYLELELMKYRDEKTAPPNPVMGMMAKSLKPEDISALAHFYASQK